MEYLQLIGGLVLLVFSGDYLVRGGVSLARYFKLSTLVVGFTVVAFGTSAPELIVSLGAAVTGHPEIAIGNVIGSNIANIALVLGLTAAVMAMPVKAETIRYGWPVMMAVSLLFYAFMADSAIAHWEGYLLVCALVLFIVVSIYRSKKKSEDDEIVPPHYRLWVCIVMILLSCIGLAFGADLLIEGASGLARDFGISERIISITIVAFGTSVPELTASLIAAFKKETDISIGNIIGSNIFNLLAVIGFTATVKPIPVDFASFEMDILWMLFFTILLLLFILPAGRNFLAFQASRFQNISVFKNMEGGKLRRLEGWFFFFLYVVYIVSLF